MSITIKLDVRKIVLPLEFVEQWMRGQSPCTDKEHIDVVSLELREAITDFINNFIETKGDLQDNYVEFVDLFKSFLMQNNILAVPNGVYELKLFRKAKLEEGSLS